MPAIDAAYDPCAVTEQLSDIVREAGALAMAKFRSTFRSWFKDGTSPVSEIDIAVDELLHERLGRVFPAFGWLSEESVDDSARLGCSEVWIVDPIDGTRGFIAGLPDWAVSVALVVAGRPVSAALFAPAEQRMYLATAGHGATVNGTTLSASDASGFAGARVAGPKRRIDFLAARAAGIEALPKVSSLALRIARVASGMVDVAFAGPNSHDWDLAAADLIVEEAGGCFTTYTGEKPIYNKAAPVHSALVATGPGRHGPLLDIMRDFG